MNKPKNPSEKFDAIIVGARPAGAECAREMAKKGRKVLLMEKSQVRANQILRAREHPNETIKDFGLPLSVTRGVWSKVSDASERPFPYLGL